MGTAKCRAQAEMAMLFQTHFEKIVSIMGVKFMFDQFNAYFEDHSLRPISSERVSTILPEIMELSICHRCNISIMKIVVNDWSWYYKIY